MNLHPLWIAKDIICCVNKPLHEIIHVPVCPNEHLRNWQSTNIGHKMFNQCHSTPAYLYCRDWTRRLSPCSCLWTFRYIMYFCIVCLYLFISVLYPCSHLWTVRFIVHLFICIYAYDLCCRGWSRRQCHYGLLWTVRWRSSLTLCTQRLSSNTCCFLWPVCGGSSCGLDTTVAGTPAWGPR